MPRAFHHHKAWRGIVAVAVAIVASGVLVALTAAPAARAADAPPPASSTLPTQQVTVNGGRAPDMEQKSYRDLLKAMARFEPYRQRHPDAQLRFHVMQRKAGVDMTTLRVWLDDPDDGTRVDIDLAPDGRFTVPVLPALRDHDAVVRTDMPDGTLAWEVEIHRAGADERHAVQGDLREACRLDVDVAHLARGIKPPAFWAEDAIADNVCLLRGVGWGFYADRPVFSEHLAAPGRRGAVLSDALHCKLVPAWMALLTDPCDVLRDRFYVAPLNDASWPDDTAVDLVYVDDVDDTAVAATEARP